MQLEDYFEFEKFDTKFGPAERIRIKGHRISIENVLGYYHQGVSPEQIQLKHYPTLTLEEVYGTITYYLQNKDRIEAYIRRSHEVEYGYYKEYLSQEPSPIRQKMQALRSDMMGMVENAELVDWARYHGVPEGLSAVDPRFNGWVVLRFPDQSNAIFQHAFAVEVPQEKVLVVFTEHCGYHRFPLGDLEWYNLAPRH